MSVASPRLAKNLEAVRSRIAHACDRARRDPRDVRLVAVTKSVGAHEASEIVRMSTADLGENRVDSLAEKRASLDGLGLAPRWHMIGHLQTNKVRRALSAMDVLHSLDRDSLLDALARELARSEGPELPAFVQVNVSGETTKGGFPPDELVRVLEACRGIPRLAVCGLMTMAPLSGSGESSRPIFRRLRELRDEVVTRGYREVLGLSMGMSQDFEAAIEEGSTHVRVGTLLFED